jgi:hypothetical protein
VRDPQVATVELTKGNLPEAKEAAALVELINSLGFEAKQLP